MKPKPEYHHMRVVPIQYVAEYEKLETEVLCLTWDGNINFRARVYDHSIYDNPAKPHQLETRLSRIPFQEPGGVDELNALMQKKTSPASAFSADLLWESFYESRLELAVQRAYEHAQGKRDHSLPADCLRQITIMRAYTNALQRPLPLSEETAASLVKSTADRYYQKNVTRCVQFAREAAGRGDVDKLLHNFNEANEAAVHLGYTLSKDIQEQLLRDAYQKRLRDLEKQRQSVDQVVTEAEQRKKEAQQRRKVINAEIKKLENRS